MKLKTLKDFDYADYEGNIDEDELREEGIKHIKNIYFVAEGEMRILSDKDKHEIDWIKYFFNITEDDLK